MKNLTGLLCLLFIVIAPINFIAFGYHYQTLGGDALGGYQKNGHFYVSSKDSHGSVYYPEVTEWQWRFSRWHGYSLIVTHTLGLGAILLAIFRDAFPQPIFWSADERAPIVREIRRSGHRQVEFKCSGQFRVIRLSFLKIAIYPGGIVCEVWGLAEFGITLREIDSIKRDAVFLDTGATIVHISPFLGSPISLHFADNKAAIEALMSLAP